MKTSSIVLLVAIAGVVGLMLYYSKDSFSQYTNFAEARKAAQEVHVVGEWVNREDAQYDANRDLFQFYLRDTTGETQLVHYFDPKPVNFETAEKVVVIGKFPRESAQPVFVAEKILMKCPSKYEATEIAPQAEAAVR